MGLSQVRHILTSNIRQGWHKHTSLLLIIAAVKSSTLMSQLREDIKDNGTQHYNIHDSDTQHNNKYNATTSIMTLSIMPEQCYAECLVF
jgi:hypothetical protein